MEGMSDNCGNLILLPPLSSQHTEPHCRQARRLAKLCRLSHVGCAGRVYNNPCGLECCSTLVCLLHHKCIPPWLKQV